MLLDMRGSRGVVTLGAVLALMANGCGGDSETTGTPTSGAGQGGGATPGAGGSNNTPGGAAGTATSAGAAQGGTSGIVSGKACQGTYGPPTSLFSETSPFGINGPTVTADELQLFYSVSDNTTAALVESVVYRQRQSVGEAFGPSQTLPELANVCLSDQHVNPDISEDGLTLYVTCTAHVNFGLSEGPSALRVARRSDRSASFTLDAEPAGSVFASAGLSADELSAYSSGEISGTAPQKFTRASKTEKFGAAQPVPGFTTPLNSPDISADGLTLFGAAPSSLSGRQVLIRATRASVTQDFGPPSDLDFGMPTVTTGAPNVTPGCSLYFVMVTIPATGTGSELSVQLARPQ
jgi:hypothetical protein